MTINVLAAAGYVVLADNNQPDVTWMIEGIDIETMTEKEIDILVEQQAWLYNEFNPGEEQAGQDDIEQAKLIIKKIQQQRKT